MTGFARIAAGFAVATLALTGCTKPTAPPAHASTTTVDLADLPKGTAPSFPWVTGNTFHYGPRKIPLGDGLVFDAALTGDRLITRMAPGDGDAVVQVRDMDGTVTATYPDPTSRIVVNAGGNIAAWIGPDGVAMALQDGEDKPIAVASKVDGESADAAAVLGKDCAHGPETVKGAGCSVFYTVTRGNRRVPVVASNHGFSEDASKDIEELSDVSTKQALVGTVKITGPRVCSKYEGETSYSTCAFMPHRFSPNGRYLLGGTTEISEGPAMNRTSVHVADTGKPVVTIKSPQGKYTLWDSEWEDASHFLTLVVDDPRWAVVRTGLDGKSEIALGPFTKGDASAFHFAVQP